jgi:hypothetical protein
MKKKPPEIIFANFAIKYLQERYLIGNAAQIICKTKSIALTVISRLSIMTYTRIYSFPRSTLNLGGTLFIIGSSLSISEY